MPKKIGDLPQATVFNEVDRVLIEQDGLAKRVHGELLNVLYQLRSEEGQVSGYPSLDETGKVPIAQLPVGPGATQVAPGDHTHAGAAEWGDIGGTLSDQTDLQGALDGKSPTAHDHDAAYAPIAKGVTNGDSHNHAGGDGGQIAYADLSSLPTIPAVAEAGEVADCSTVAEADGTSPRYARADHVHKYVDSGGGGGGITEIPWHAHGSANFALTNSPLAERIALNQPTRMCKFVPASGFTQVRMVGVQAVTSASVNTPKVKLKYKTGDYSATPGNYSDIGTSSVELSLTGTGAKDTGWIDLAAGAKADVWVTLTELGGDGAADPAFGHLQVYFK
jgi:hypothetical protein